jgi:hypothetical protein
MYFPTAQGGTTATKYLRTPRSYRRRIARIDGRSRAYQAIKYRTAQYAKALGDRAAEPMTRSRIIELAELEVLTSEMRAAGLRGERIGSFDMEQLARFSNACVRLRRALGLHAESPLDPEPPGLENLAELLRAK